MYAIYHPTKSLLWRRTPALHHMGDEAEPAPAEPVPAKAEAADPEAAAAAPEAAEAAPEAAEAAPEASDAVPEAPPGETELDIRFVIVPEGFSHTRRFALATTVAEVKAMCEEDLKIPVPNMKLVHAGEELFDGQTLESSGLKGGGLSQVELQIVYLEEHITPAPAYVMPDVVSVEVQFGADIPPKLIQVRQPALQSRPQPQSQPSRHRMHRCGSGSAHHRPRGLPPPQHTPSPPRPTPPTPPLPLDTGADRARHAGEEALPWWLPLAQDGDRVPPRLVADRPEGAE